MRPAYLIIALFIRYYSFRITAALKDKQYRNISTPCVSFFVNSDLSSSYLRQLLEYGADPCQALAATQGRAGQSLSYLI